MFGILSLLFACQTMDSPGAAFAQVQIAEGQTTPVEPIATEPVEEAVDPRFQSRKEVVIVGGSSDDAAEDKSQAPSSELSSKEEDSPKEVAVEQSVSLPVAQVAPAQPMRVSRVKDGWRPTLIASVMDGPTPRAILAMPSGEERIVKAGDLLAEEGVVVMTIGASFVELAVINSNEGRATVENLTLTEQF